jgi:plastocyanin
VKAKPLVPLIALAGFIGLGGLPCHWQRATAVAGAQSAGIQEVHVALGEWSLTPEHVSVLAGAPVRFVATNGGVLAHALAIEGDGFYAETDAIGSRQSATLDVTFLPGLYDLYCPVAAGQHRALGQDGKLEAVADAVPVDLSAAVEAATDTADPDQEALATLD